MVEIFASQVGHFSGFSGILDLKTPKMPNLRGNYMLYDRRHLNGCNSFSPSWAFQGPLAPSSLKPLENAQLERQISLPLRHLLS